MEAIEKTVSKAEVSELKVSEISVTGWNPRNGKEAFKGEAFEELKRSIQTQGIIEPLIVRPNGKKFDLVAGERRLKAAKDLELETVPVVVRDLDDVQAQEVMLLENLIRENLKPLEEAAALERLLKSKITQEELAKRIGKSQPWVANRVRLLKAPEDLKKLLAEEEISPQHVVVLLPYMEHKQLVKPIMEELKGQLKTAEDGGDQVTVDSLDDVIRFATNGLMWPLDQFSWQDEGLSKYFDYGPCEKCPSMLAENGDDKKKERSCLDQACYAKHIGEARSKMELAQKEKLAKSEIVKTDKLSYSDYRRLEDATFDKAACKECPNRKLEKSKFARFGKPKGELDEICLKPSCFQGKTAQTSRVKNQAFRQELVFVEESLKSYIESRHAGLSTQELLWILDQVDMWHTPKKGASVKDLENALLKNALDRELRDIKYSLNLAHLKQVERDWPFEVKRKKAEEGSKKVVKEKRIKGAKE